MHSSLDWSIAYLYATPFSGYTLERRLIEAQIQGNLQITGGAAGPRASLLIVPVLILLAAAIARLTRGRIQRNIPCG